MRATQRLPGRRDLQERFLLHAQRPCFDPSTRSGATSSAHRLGSNSVMSYGQGHGNVGTVVPNSCGRYFPYGGWRVTPTAGLTDQGYTGHKHNNLGSTADDLGLIFMNARYYLPSAGRFISADTIVPDPTNPQQFNRYTYALNNALRYTDPTGRCGADTTIVNQRSGLNGRDDSVYLQCSHLRKELESTYDISITGTWLFSEMQILAEALSQIVQAVYRAGVANPQNWFREVFANTTIHRARIEGNTLTGPCQGSLFCSVPSTAQAMGSSITLFNGTFRDGRSREAMYETVAHELGHVWDNRTGGALRSGLMEAVGGSWNRCLLNFCSGYQADPRNDNAWSPMNPAEDWAESWASFVMRDALTPDRAQFISNQFSATIFDRKFLSQR
jgi:RHS repeat-associated protein